MILTLKQEQGLKECIERYKNGEKYCVISGYAGAGKSTLVKVIIDNLPGINPVEDVVYACYTGKAAQVLLKKGNKNVITLHKLLYESIPKPDGTFFRVPRDEIDYSVVVVDEVSMAPRTLMELLFKHDCFIICLGDPFQLPPIDKDQDNGLLTHPHVFLDEIMRQALDSNIIRLSMKIRNQDKIEYGKDSDAIVMPYEKLSTGVLTWGDQILVGTNKVRININQTLRNMQGRGPEPEEGDKVICLRNYWDNLADNDDPLVNGTVGYISNLYTSYNKIPPYCGGQTIPVLYADFISDSDADFGTLNMDKHQIITGERSLDARTIFKLNSRRPTQHLVPMEFTYAYAITTHKAQGSEWDKVVVLEEGFPFAREEHARWLYTAVTRASEQLVLVR